MNILDSVTKRGKRKDAMVNNPSFFVSGMKVDFMRRNEPPDKGFQIIGTATIEDVNIRDKVLKFNALPAGVRADDLVTLHSNYEWGTLLNLERHWETETWNKKALSHL